MKKLLLSITAVISASSLMAQQYDLEAVLVTPAEGATVVGTSSTIIDYSVKNNGPATVAAGDTLWLSYTIGVNLYSLTGVPNGTSGIIIPASGFPPNVLTLTSAMIGTRDTLDLSGITTPTEVCALVLGTNGARMLPEDPRDADNDNNWSCFMANPAPASLTEESSIVASVYPNPASEVLNIKSSEVVGSVRVLTMDGKVLAQSTSTSVNISALNAGTYVYIVTTLSGRTAIGNFMKN